MLVLHDLLVFLYLCVAVFVWIVWLLFELVFEFDLTGSISWVVYVVLFVDLCLVGCYFIVS